MQPLISTTEATDIILGPGTRTGSEKVALEDAYGRVLHDGRHLHQHLQPQARLMEI